MIEEIELLKKLYQILSKNTKLDGNFEFDEYTINWKRNGDVFLQINTDYIAILKSKKSQILNDYQEITHFHPENNEEIIKFCNEIGNKDNILVCINIFPHIIFVGKSKIYKCRKRYKFIPFKKYIFGKL